MIDKFHYIRGGAETYCFNLANALSAAGHDVIFFSMKHPANRPCAQAEYFVSEVAFDRSAGIAECLKNLPRVLYNREARQKLANLINKEKPDIAHINLIHRHLSVSVLDALWEAEIPIVWTVHDFILQCPAYLMLRNGAPCSDCVAGKTWSCVRNRCIKRSLPKSLTAFAENALFKWKNVSTKVDAFICPTEFYKNMLLQGGYAPEKTYHINNPLAVDFPYHAGNQGVSYLYSGRLSREKGLFTLLHAMQKLPDVSCVIAGEGPLKDDLRAFICEKDLKNVCLIGKLSQPALWSLVAQSRAVIVPSEWYENGSYAAMEAMGLGRPVIASDMGGLPEHVEDGTTGLLFKAADSDALAKAVRHMESMPDNALQLMGKAALAKARVAFSAHVYAHTVIDLYKKILRAKCTKQAAK